MNEFFLFFKKIIQITFQAEVAHLHKNSTKLACPADTGNGVRSQVPPAGLETLKKFAKVFDRSLTSRGN